MTNPLFTGVFGKQIPTGFDYNKKDQTRDPLTFCFCALIEFVGCLTNGTRPCDVFRQKRFYKSDKDKLSLNCKYLKER